MDTLTSSVTEDIKHLTNNDNFLGGGTNVVSKNNSTRCTKTHNKFCENE